VPFAREQVETGSLFCPLFPIALFVMEEELCGCESLMRNAPDAKEPVFIQEAVSTVGLVVVKALCLRKLSLRKLRLRNRQLIK
jgi:hypothetical protein